MALYRLTWKTSAEKDLRRLPREVIGRLITIAEGLMENPFPPGVRKLSGTKHTFRLRSGDYRVVYSVDGDSLTIEIVRAGHRKEVYRR